MKHKFQDIKCTIKAVDVSCKQTLTVLLMSVYTIRRQLLFCTRPTQSQILMHSLDSV